LVKFLQTSDWQIGMKGGGLGEAGPIVREVRISSIHNVLKSARDHAVNFVLMCGDAFEHNMVSQDDVKKVITILNRYSDIPVYLLPGNHDSIGAGSVYDRDIFVRVRNLNIIRTCDPIEVSGAILHPCPILSRSMMGDITKDMPEVRGLSGIHIGVAHGSLKGAFSVPNWEDVDFLIGRDCVDRTGIDYLALGHWHSQRTFQDSAGIVRIAYSGTHEQTGYGEDDAGLCLLVEIDDKGGTPKIEPIRTGQLTWVSNKFEVKDRSSVTELKYYFETIKGIDMVKLSLFGDLPLESKEELDNILAFQGTMHKNFVIEAHSLNVWAPMQSERPLEFEDPVLSQSDKQLRELLANETEPERRNVIIEALALLGKLGKEAIQ
jgi:DNA repair exonuclease SbcCD nuclease subunit